MKRTKLYQACCNNHGFFESSVGDDISRLSNVSASTIARYVHKGWITKCGSGFKLTKRGHDEC